MTEQERVEIDAEVLLVVRRGNVRLSSITAAVARRSPAYPVNERLVDRSLQRLRKADKIRFMSPGGWQEVKS